ncbi:DUF3159 domain-containing protein [Nocardioides sp. MAHUQ-72]|uniref:DUF3159 domain-containing protein n=1 Tax=unclassified Nocardioides TaxID=2615069 RepID=UPI00361D3714
MHGSGPRLLPPRDLRRRCLRSRVRRSALLGRPLVGHLHAALFRLGPEWRRSARLRRVFTIATLGWSGVFALRTVAQGVLYAQGRTELLALSKLLLGWPVTVAAVVLTLAAVRRACAGRCPPPPARAR